MSPQFILKEVDAPKSLGEILKKARLERALSIKDVERLTKIRAKYLEALEDGHYEKLPADVYVKGFLKTYSRILMLDEKKVIQLYKRETSIQKNIKKTKEPQIPKPLKSPRIIITPKSFITAILLLVSLIVLSYIWYQFVHFAGPPPLTIHYPPKELTTKSASIVIEGKTNPEAEVLINNQLIATNPDGNFSVTITLQNGLNIITITARSKTGKETSEERKILADLPAESIASEGTNPTSLEQPKTQELTLNLKINPTSSWIKILADDKLVYEGVMLPGANQTFKAKEYFLLSTGNAGSTKLMLNNRDLGTLGSQGEVKKNIRLDANTTSLP